jgi:menaquinol-cytochrome c reductase iron-sulfur subunit
MLLAAGTAAVSALLSVPLIRFALYPLLTSTTETRWSELGAAAEFSSIATPVKRVITVEQRDGWRKVIAERSVYVCKGEDGRLRVLSVVCPHLGCSVPWIEAKKEFICPCHGAVFSPDGARIGGPAPRSMDELPTRIQDGKLLVRYQYFRQLMPTKEVIG